MRCMLRIPLALLAMASLVGATAANAAVIVNTTVNIAPSGAVHAPYDPAVDAPASGPMLSASSIDLAQGLTEAGGGISTTGNDNQEESFGIDATTDGSLATVHAQGGNAGDAIDHAAYGTINIGDLVTYNLGGLFNLSQVDVFAAWNDSGRDQSSFNLAVSANGVDYTTIGSYTKFPDNDTGTHTTPVTNLHSFVDDGAADIATAVRYVQLQITNADNNWSGLAEVDVFGTAVPEPASFALCGLAGLALALQRKRN
jgi:hypothetical protein